ncbi:MAG: hypothetical protein AB2A00_17530 [Myxococcota bacterium]
MSHLFIERSNHRKLPADYRGDILVWDIDKTYLDTRFSSVRGLLGIALEAALDKRAIPGAVPLLRGLRRGVTQQSALTPLYFVSGSPVQLRGILERKMLLDSVDHDGIAFKDQLGLLKNGRPLAIVEQVGYKLCALLMYRRELPHGARYLFFGDDAESDATVFTLFGEVCAGLRGAELKRRMQQLGAFGAETEGAVELSSGLPAGPDPVERIFIRLERNTDPARLTSGVVTPVRSFLQAALVLLDMKRITPNALLAVAEDLRRNMVPEYVIREHVADARARLGVTVETTALLEQNAPG